MILCLLINILLIEKTPTRVFLVYEDVFIYSILLVYQEIS